MDESQPFSSPSDASPTASAAPVTPPSAAPPPEPSYQPPPAYAPPPPPPYQPKSRFGMLATILVFAALFGIGYWASGWIRQYLNTTPSTAQPTPEPSLAVPTPLFQIPVSTLSGTTGNQFADWVSYDVISGVTRRPVDSLSYKLPASVQAPVCDGSDCRSQGTYLPGGTRFTVAPRGAGQILPDFRGKIVSDINGKAFTVKTTTILGKNATEFSGTFSGETVSNYPFTAMHGLMIEITDTLSLEINHFAPSGVSADFAADEAVFANILRTLNLGEGTSKGAVIPALLSPTATASPKPTSAATSSAGV